MRSSELWTLLFLFYDYYYFRLFVIYCCVLSSVEPKKGRMVNRIRKLVCLVAERFMCWPICIFFYVLAVSLGCSRGDKSFMCPFSFYIFFNSLANLPFWWAYHLFWSPLILIIYQAILNEEVRLIGFFCTYSFH